MRQLSASVVHRLLPVILPQPHLGCAYWLRDTVEHFEEEPGSAAELGTKAHDLFETHCLQGPAKAVEKLAAVEETYPLHAKLHAIYYNWVAWWDGLEQLPGDVWHLELPLRWNPTTNTTKRILGQAGKRDYSSVDSTKEITATLDLVVERCPNGLKTIEVIDYKTGSNLVPARDIQMLVMGAMAAAYWEVDKVKLTVITVHEDGVWPDSSWLTKKEIEGVRFACEWALDLVVQPVTEEKTRPHAGPYCSYCPAVDCPERTKFLAALPPNSIQEPFWLTDRPRSDAHAQWLVAAIPQAEAFVEQVKEGLKAYADSRGGIKLSNGSTYSSKENVKLKPKLTEQAYRYLRSIGLEKAAIRFTTWAELKKQAPDMDLKTVFINNGWTKEEKQLQYRTRKK